MIQRRQVIPIDEPRSQAESDALQPVRIEFRDPVARSVSVVGSFSQWRELPLVNLGGGRWLRLLFLSPGTYEYRFVVDGRSFSRMPHFLGRRCSTRVNAGSAVALSQSPPPSATIRVIVPERSITSVALTLGKNGRLRGTTQCLRSI
jgi:hypothetical protein